MARRRGRVKRENGRSIVTVNGRRYKHISSEGTSRRLKEQGYLALLTIFLRVELDCLRFSPSQVGRMLARA